MYIYIYIYIYVYIYIYMYNYFTIISIYCLKYAILIFRISRSISRFRKL